MSEKPQNSFTNPNLQHVITPEQGGGRVSEKPNPSTGELDQIPTLSTAPETAAALSPAVEADKPWYRTTAAKIGAGALVVVAGVATTVGLMLPKGETAAIAPETSETPAASAPATPGETAKQAPNYAELIVSQEIKSGQTPEALAQDVTVKINNWGMAGTDTFTADYNAEVAKTGDGSDATRTKFADDYAKKQFTEIYGPALFGIKSGDVVDPGLQKVIDGLTSINSGDLQLHWLTSKEDVPYTRGQTMDALRVGGQDDDKVTLFIDYTEIDNASQNRASESYSANGVTNPNGHQGTLVVTLISNGATQTITTMDFNDR